MRTAYSIPIDKREEILRKAISVASSVDVDELDCSKSFSRQPTSKTVEQVLQLGLKNKTTHYTFIFRDMSLIKGEDNYYDVGLSTIGHQPEYFLWIKLSVSAGQKLIKEYDML